MYIHAAAFCSQFALGSSEDTGSLKWHTGNDEAHRESITDIYKDGYKNTYAPTLVDVYVYA